VAERLAAFESSLPQAQKQQLSKVLEYYQLYFVFKMSKSPQVCLYSYLALYYHEKG
jgi:hypothetical protein